MKDFYFEVYEFVQIIPKGKVASYGQIAQILGKPQNSREVGRAMKFCPNDIPWHRVVKSDGSINFGEEQKAKLVLEGVKFLKNGKINMKECRFY
ncbi:MAG: MGMT family protein [Defluviitaleaceae bacterium]|nr:MGMT family protein [Defluviitaleaceae bacterium]